MCAGEEVMGRSCSRAICTFLFSHTLTLSLPVSVCVCLPFCLCDGSW